MKSRKRQQEREFQQARKAAADAAVAVTRQIFQNSGYSESAGSYTKRSMRGFIADSRSPVEDIDMNLFTVRQRSRSLYMGAPLARSAIDTHLINVVGPGLVCRPKPNFKFLGISRDQAKEWESETLREFNFWAASKHCDATRVNNFFEIQGLMLTSWLMNGDGFALMDNVQPTPYMPYGLRIHLIESDRITNPDTTAFSGLEGQVWYNAKNGNRVYNGVEIDNNGMIVAYHVCNFYPNSFVPSMQQRIWTPVVAFDPVTGMENIIHVMYSERAEQYRGVPLLAPVIETLKQLTRYIDAESIAAVINSFFTAFITTKQATEGMPFATTVPDEHRVTRSDNDYELGPGNINILNEGESVEFAEPKRPGNNFDSFVTSMAKYTGSAVGVPYEQLLKSFNSSYSAARAGLLEAWKGYRTRRAWFARGFCQPVYEQWLSEAVARGRILAPGFFDDPAIRHAWSQAEWNGPSQGQIDPLKEVMAAEHRVKNGFSTYERETTELTGGDWEANIQTIIRENAQLREAYEIFNPDEPAPQALPDDGVFPSDESTPKGGESS